MRSCSKEQCFVRRDGGELCWAVLSSIGGLWSRSSGLGAVLLSVCEGGGGEGEGERGSESRHCSKPPSQASPRGPLRYPAPSSLFWCSL